MRRPAPILASLFLLALLVACRSSDAPYIDEEDSVPEGARAAKEVIDRWVELSWNFNPAVADLYLDHAGITNLRHYPTGETRRMSLRGVEYKKLIREAMPVARARNDRSFYSDFEYEVKGHREVVITAQRYSVVKQYTSPITWRLDLQNTGAWMIAEEHSESRP